MKVLLQAGLPPGVLNFVPMSREDSPTLIQQIIAHPLVRKVTVSFLHELHLET